jgi:hypothetical protein
MGGVPASVEAELLRNTDVVPGRYAAGEVACVSGVQSGIVKLKERCADVAISDKGKRYDSGLLEALPFRRVRGDRPPDWRTTTFSGKRGYGRPRSSARPGPSGRNDR